MVSPAGSRAILAARRDGGVVSEEGRAFVNGFVKGRVPDYSASAFLMACCIRGVSDCGRLVHGRVGDEGV